MPLSKQYCFAVNSLLIYSSLKNLNLVFDIQENYPKEIATIIPNTKITVLDMSNFIFDMFLEYGDASWVETRTEGLNPYNVTRYNYAYFKEVRNKFDKNKSIGLVFGSDKPRTFINKDNNFFIMFNDRAANLISVADNSQEYTNCEIELFYWSPDALDLLCKQAHVIKRWVEFNPDKKDSWINFSGEKFRLVHERLLRSILYSTWNDSWWQADKSVKEWDSEFDYFFTTIFTIELLLKLVTYGVLLCSSYLVAPPHIVPRLP
jgi:hypothetical protein